MFQSKSEIWKQSFEDIPRHRTKSTETNKIGKCPNCKRSFCCDMFSEFCSKSGVHGLQYIGEEERPIYERILWIIFLVLSIYGCSRLSYNIWTKWEQAPVIVSFDEKSTPIWNVPFPSVTICPQTKANREIFNFTATLSNFRANNSTIPENITLEELRNFRALGQVCSSFPHTEYNLTTNDELDIIERLEYLSFDFNDTFLGCRKGNVIVDCNELFVKILTEDGICYNYNGFDVKDLFREENLNNDTLKKYNRTITQWSLQNGYDQDIEIEDCYPERVLGAGTKNGLSVFLQGYKNHTDYLCTGPSQGFKIILHSPDEMPKTTHSFIRLQYGQQLQVSVKPNMMGTSDNLRSYLPNQRQCFFNEQRYLRYFKVYSQKNCQSECLANYTLSKCGCIHFSMPKANNTRFCDTAELKCFMQAEIDYLKDEFKRSQQKEIDSNRCDCLPACTSLVYDSEISQSSFDFRNVIDTIEGENATDNEGVLLSNMNIFFKEDQFITSKRSELYGTTDFLANCGGLLGLFMGVSVLSLAEIIYFWTIRLLSNFRMRRRIYNINSENIEKNA